VLYYPAVIEPRITTAVLGIFAVLFEDVRQPRYGLEIAKAADLSHTTIYDILARLEAAGWLRSEWEIQNSHTNRRPRRRLYRLTPLGERTARRSIEAQFQTLTREHKASRWTPEPSGAS
jgi:PadR family transcriptional regulator PadR